MTKPMGYYGCNYANPLIADIAEHFEELQKINVTDQVWLIARLGGYSWFHYCKHAPSDAAEELVERAERLPALQMLRLIQALGDDTTRPLGYYHINYELPLIRDIVEYYGENLSEMDATDRMWIIGKLADLYCTLHLEDDESTTEGADAVWERIHELGEVQCQCLIKALVNS